MDCFVASLLAMTARASIGLINQLVETWRHVIAGRPKAELVKGVIDHMAFSGQGLNAAVDKLKQRGVKFELRRLPHYGTWQLFFFDPNNARVEIDFDKSEQGPADAPAGVAGEARV